MCFEVFTGGAKDRVHAENGFAFKTGNNDKGLGFSKIA